MQVFNTRSRVHYLYSVTFQFVLQVRCARLHSTKFCSVARRRSAAAAASAAALPDFRFQFRNSSRFREQFRCIRYASMQLDAKPFGRFCITTALRDVR